MRLLILSTLAFFLATSAYGRQSEESRIRDLESEVETLRSQRAMEKISADIDQENQDRKEMLKKQYYTPPADPPEDQEFVVEDKYGHIIGYGDAN